MASICSARVLMVQPVLSHVLWQLCAVVTITVQQPGAHSRVLHQQSLLSRKQLGMSGSDGTFLWQSWIPFIKDKQIICQLWPLLLLTTNCSLLANLTVYNTLWGNDYCVIWPWLKPIFWGSWKIYEGYMETCGAQFINCLSTSAPPFSLAYLWTAWALPGSLWALPVLSLRIRQWSDRLVCTFFWLLMASLWLLSNEWGIYFSKSSQWAKWATLG